MKILALCAYYPPEVAASLYLLEDIFKSFIKAGHEVSVVCPTPCRGIDIATRKYYKKHKNETKYDGKLKIYRFNLYKEPQSVFRRFFRYYIMTWKFFFKGLFKKCDLIFAQSTPPIIGLALSKLKFFKHTPVVYNLQDVFPDSLVSTNLTKKGSLLWRIGRVIENKTYKKSNKIVCISKEFEKNLIAKNVPIEKIVVMPNWPDIENIKTIDKHKNVLYAKYNLDPSKKSVVYCGNIGYTQNIQMLSDTAKNMPDILFVVVGDGAAKDELLSLTSNLTNFVVIPFQDYNLISEVFSLGDAGIIISKKGVGKNSVPSKTWGYMAVGKPIVASFDLDSELATIIKKANAGFCSDPDDLDGFVSNIREAIYNQSIGLNGTKYISTFLNKDKLLKKYVDLIESCANL